MGQQFESNPENSRTNPEVVREPETPSHRTAVRAVLYNQESTRGLSVVLFAARRAQLRCFSPSCCCHHAPSRPDVIFKNSVALLLSSNWHGDPPREIRAHLQHLLHDAFARASPGGSYP